MLQFESDTQIKNSIIQRANYMKENILFIYNNYSTFVKADYEILSSKHDVKKYYFKSQKGFGGLLELTKQFIFIITKIWRFDSVFIWFADYHSFLPVLFTKVLRKKSFVIVGGYDVANIPELNYGSLSKPLRKAITLFTFKHASCCLPVVESLEKKLIEVCPSAKTETIYTGYSAHLERHIPIGQHREKIILTVAITNSRQRMLIKGLDRFKELAEMLPDYQFRIVGVYKHARNLLEPAPDNLSILPPLEEAELIDHYCEASFYAQFSRSEGLPNSLCEAMLYGCIPMGIDIGGIATAINSLGLVMNEWNSEAAADFIRDKHNQLDRELFKEFIENKFNLDYRTERLLEKI